MKKVALLASLVATFLFAVPSASANYTYSLTDINSGSATSGQTVSPENYLGKVTLHYFGSQC